MKKGLIAAIFVIFTAISCSDDDPIPVPSAGYMNFAAGARWDYEVRDSSVVPPTVGTYSITSTNRDTLLSGRQYHIFERSTGGFEFYAVSGTDHYSYFTFPDPINMQTEYLYLKAAAPVGTSWQAASIQLNPPTVPIPVTGIMTNTIVEKGLTKVVNGKTYTNVIHVSSSISLPGIPGNPVTSDIHTYYAISYGQIEGSLVISSTLAPINIDTDTRLMTSNF